MSFVIKGNKALGKKTEASSLLEHRRRKWVNIKCLMPEMH
jgi:hypothetical protein